MNIDYCTFQRWVRNGLRWLLWADITATVSFAALIAIFWFGPIIEGRVAAEQSPAARSGISEAFTQEQVSQMVTGKAPFRASGSVKEKVIDELSHFQLKGVASKASKKCAYIRDNKLKRMLIKQVGESIGPYEIIEIKDQSIVVQRGAETLVMSKG